jgi:hypothetical protein
MYEIARNSSGLLDGRKPFENEGEARATAQALADEHGEAFQLWDSARMIDVICPGNADPKP